jgi:hypothetical protein
VNSSTAAVSLAGVLAGVLAAFSAAAQPCGIVQWGAGNGYPPGPYSSPQEACALRNGEFDEYPAYGAGAIGTLSNGHVLASSWDGTAAGGYPGTYVYCDYTVTITGGSSSTPVVRDLGQGPSLPYVYAMVPPASCRRDWQFPVAQGSVTVRLASTPSTEDGNAVYTLQIIAGKTTPSVAQEAAFLKAVTTAMQADGMPPERIAAITLELREPDAGKKLALAAYKSKEWRGAKSSDYGLIVAKLLNSVRAYGAFNQVFGHYGLTVEVAHAEYISTIRPQEIGLSPNGVHRLPSGATLNIVLRRKALTPPRGAASAHASSGLT